MNEKIILQLSKKKLLKVVFGFAVIATIGSTLYAMKAEALAWHLWHQFNSRDHQGLNLSDYEVSIEGKPLADYKNASGLAYNHETGTLFTVLNDKGLIVEFSLDGEPVREIKVHGTDDLEGISHLEKDFYVVADERESKLWLLQIKADTREISVKDAKLLGYGINERGNKNFEGVTYDSVHHRLIVVKERDPKYVMSVTGLYEPDASKQSQIEMKHMRQFDPALKWALRDLSSVTYHEPSGHFFLLSDESKLLKQFNEAGQALGSLALWKGFHGLHESVPQAEGVSIDNQGNVYIVSEPNLFYMFKLKAQARHS
ncbi:SdiA-regulated domain-containing protein [Methylophilus luteus]|uniref:SdiA-regulated domain-containing protein n=1 Tax=Methylophilus luteus TaxID=640108 RepID=A0ABW3F4Q5_9PROT